MKQQNLMKQILGASQTGRIFELQVTAETGEDKARGIPSVKTIKRHELIGANILPTVKDVYITTGRAQIGDVTIHTAEQLTMTNEIESGDFTYEIVDEIQNTNRAGTIYEYILRKIRP